MLAAGIATEHGKALGLRLVRALRAEGGDDERDARAAEDADQAPRGLAVPGDHYVVLATRPGSLRQGLVRLVAGWT